MDKNLDYKGRWRNKTVAFRVSEEEAKMIDKCVALSGLTKQDYIVTLGAHDVTGVDLVVANVVASQHQQFLVWVGLL